MLGFHAVHVETFEPVRHVRDKTSVRMVRRLGHQRHETSNKQRTYCALYQPPETVQQIKETYNRDSRITEDGLIGLINSGELLVLDDIGAESSREAWCQDKLFLILDGQQVKRTIYTTNLDAEMLEKKIGGRN